MRISIDHAEEGMILLGPVTDTKGRLILPKGVELNAHVLGRLERFGVMNLDVKGPAEGAEGEEQAAEPQAGRVDDEKLTEEIHARFSEIGDDERMGLIRDAVTRQLVRSGVSKPI